MVIRSLNRTCEALPLKYSRSEMKIKARFYFAFLSLNRTFEPVALRYSRSEMKIKARFYFAFLSLNRTFEALPPKYSRSEKPKKYVHFLWFFARLIVLLQKEGGRVI